MQLSSATQSQHHNLLPRQAYSNGTSRPQADTSEIMNRIRLPSLLSTSQVSITRTERENNVHCPHGESDASHSYNLLQDEAHLHSVPSCSVPLAFRGVLPSPRSSTAQSSAGRQKALPPVLALFLSNCSPWLSLYSQKPSTASPGSSHSWEMPVLTQQQPAAQVTALTHMLEIAWLMIYAHV